MSDSKLLTNESPLPHSSINWNDWLEIFILHKKSQGLSARTIHDYEYHVPYFFNHYAQKDLTPENLKLAILKYFADLGNGYSAYTYNTRRKILKTFFLWVVSEGLLQLNPITSIKKRREDTKPKAANEDILKQLLDLINRKTFVGLRDYAILLITMDCGIRPSEVFGLNVSDVNIKSLEVNIRASVSKTRVSRTLPLSPVTAETIKQLILNRHPAWDDNTPLFCTEDGRKAVTNTWRERLKVYGKQLGIKITPYALRHSFAVMFLRCGGNVFSLQRMLGHSNLYMTKRYVSVSQTDLVQQHTLATPLNKLVTQRNRVRNLKY